MRKILVIVSLVLALCQTRATAAVATVTATNFGGIAPNPFDSPSFPEFRERMFESIAMGLTHSGPPGLPTSFASIGSGNVSVQAVSAIGTSFRSWNGQVNAPYPFDGEYGSIAFAAIHVVGNVEQLRPERFEVNFDTTDRYDLFDYTVTGTFSSFGDNLRGINRNTSGTVSLISSGSLAPVGEFLFVKYFGFSTYGTGTDQEILNRTIEGWSDKFTITVNLRIQGTAFGAGGVERPFEAFSPTTFHFNDPIPEPSTYVLGGMGALLLIMFRRRVSSCPT